MLNWSHESGMQRTSVNEVCESTRVTERLELSQVDTQRLDQGLSDLQETVFRNGVTIERGLEECNARIAQGQRQNSSQASVEAYQVQHARGTEQALEQCRSQLVAQEKKIHDGEVRLRRLQGEVAELTRQRDLRVSGKASSSVDPELAVRLTQLEEGFRNQQRAFEQLQEDNVEDARSIKRCLDQVREMVTSSLQKQHDPPPETPETVRSQVTRLTVAVRKGDSKVEVSDPDFCRVGEVVLIGGKEARTVISKGSLIFRVPLENEYPEGTTVRPIRDNEFLQIEGEDLYVCSVDLIQREPLERAEERDDLQDRSSLLQRSGPEGPESSGGSLGPQKNRLSPSVRT